MGSRSKATNQPITADVVLDALRQMTSQLVQGEEDKARARAEVKGHIITIARLFAQADRVRP